MNTCHETSCSIFAMKEKKLKETETKFHKACRQIRILNQRFEETMNRFNSAKKEKHRSFRYKLKMKLTMLEGVRNMYLEYAQRKASEMVLRRQDLFAELVEDFVSGPGTY